MRPPSPPSDVEKLLYLRQNKTWYYTFGIISFILLIVGMSLFVLLKPEFRWYVGWLVLFASYISVSYWIGVTGKAFDFIKHANVRSRQEFPEVDVYIPVCGEPIEIIENTISHATLLNYPYDKLKIWVLDDGASDDVLELTREYDVNYIRRDDRPYMRKAGNLRHAFNRTWGKFILILDADFAPRHDMLNEMVPWMYEECDLAIVQSPQYFNTHDSVGWLQKGAAYVQELFYRLVQTNRDSIGSGAAICVGSCGLYRREALAPFGGTYPINYSEDVHTGYQLISNGWRIRYLPINLAKGLCPETIRQFFSQQHRWASGSLSLCTNAMFWGARRVSGPIKLAYLTGFAYYIATGLGVIFIPLAGISMVHFAPEYVFWWNCLYYVPSFLFGTIGMAYWGRAPFGMYVLSARQISYYAHLFALKDKVLGKKMQWIPTGAKHKESDNYGRFMGLLSAWSLSQWGLIMWGCYRNMGRIDNVDFYPHIFFASVYLLIHLRIMWTAYIEEAGN